jgi:hypothetical protein
MSILAINLKHLYQRINVRLLWLIFIGFLIPIVMVTIRGGKGVFLGVFAWVYLFGLFTASIQVEIITKPFTFCLPGYHKIPLKYLLSICFASALLFMIIFLFYPVENLIDALTTALSIAATSTMFYWLGAWVVFRFPNWMATIAFMSLLSLSREFNLPEIVKYVVVKEWLAIICAGIFINILAYLHWNNTDIARKYCGKIWLGAFDAWNKQRLKVYTESRIAAKNKNSKISPAIEDFFITRITNAGPNFERYIWGSLYQAFGLFLSQRRWPMISLAIPVSAFLFICYISSNASNMIFVMPAMMMIHAYLPINSRMLVAGGRRERFWASFATIVADTIFFIIFISFFALLSILLTPIMPVLKISDELVRFNPLDLRFFFIPIFMIPLMTTIRLVLHKIPILMMFTAILVFSSVWASTIAFLEVTRKNIVVPYVNPLSIICLVIISWSIFALVLRHICLKRNLV